MREETRKKLDRQQRWSGRAIGLIAAVVVAFAAYIYLLQMGPEEHAVSGVVQWAVWQNDPNTGQRYPSIQVKLDDGSLVLVDTLAPALPEKGARVTLRRQASSLGFRTYVWDGPTS
jgi:uncharacterized membrane protein